MTESRPLIFVIDDDESVRQAMKRLLRSVGYQVKTFASAEDYLERGRHEAPSCLVLDVWMPGRSGLELQEELVASDCLVPIIFITAHDDEDARRRATEANAAAFLQKPFEDEALLEAIRRATE